MSEKEDWKVDERVQWSDWVEKEEVIYTGTITALVTATREKRSYGYGYSSYNRKSETEEFVEKVVVKWDDGEEETLEAYQVDPEDNEMERLFRNSIKVTTTRIDEKLALASKYLREAVEISEETGIPFSTGISFLSQAYVPRSFEGKFPDVNRELMSSLCEVHNDYDGWQHSAVC